MAKEISIPVGAFSKRCRLRVFTCALQTRSDPLFLCRSLINQLPERRRRKKKKPNPWPCRLNPPGSGGGGIWMAYQAPFSNLQRALSLCLATGEAGETGQYVGGGSHLPVFNYSLSSSQPWHFKTMQIITPMKFINGICHDISLLCKAADTIIIPMTSFFLLL